MINLARMEYNLSARNHPSGAGSVSPNGARLRGKKKVSCYHMHIHAFNIIRTSLFVLGIHMVIVQIKINDEIDANPTL